MIIQKLKVLTKPKLLLLNTQWFKETITNSVRVTRESALVSVRLFSRVTQSWRFLTLHWPICWSKGLSMRVT